MSTLTDRQHTVDAALALDVLSGLLSTGQPLTRGLSCLARSIPGCASIAPVATALELGVEWDIAWDLVEDDTSSVSAANSSRRDLAELEHQLRFAFTSAVPTAEVLRSAASTLRRNRRRRAEQLAAELGTRLVLPLGACLLPSFICLGVIPMVIALLPG